MDKRVLKIDIIGGGNVACHLAKAFPPALANCRLISSRTLDGIRPDADISLICVSDNAIESVASRLPRTSSVVAHTSGSTPIEALSPFFKRYGVFYPMQTFSKEVSLQYDHIPFFIEATDEKDEKLLAYAAGLISDNVSFADSSQRKALHVAAVFACNFTNHLWSISEEILSSHGLDFEKMRPLLEETLRKTKSLPPSKCQTGPAARNDTQTMSAHMQFLAFSEHFRKLYAILSDSIINKP